MELENKRIAVTGATGFLGRYIVESLIDRRADVIGVVRNPNRVPSLAARGVSFRKADLGDRAALTVAFEGASAVVSNAALFDVSNGDWDAHVRTNVEGTENVFEAARAAGVTRIVHVSSVAVYRARDEGMVAEDHPQLSERTRRRRSTVYAISKALSEQLAVRLAEAHGASLTCVRPSAIYGAFDPNITKYLRRLLDRRVTVVPRAVTIPLVYAGDVAEAVAESLARGETASKAYNVAGDARTLGDFERAWRAVTGKPSLALPLPLRFKRLFDNTRAERELGFRNRPFEDGIRELLAREADAAARAG
jgi:nucleoside-diphosphate-sugar epimerase